MKDTRNLIDAYKGQTVEVIAADMRVRAFPLQIAIENYQHDFNIGTIVRNANAFNVAGVHIIGRRHWNRRGAMCTEKYLQLYHHASVTEFQRWTQENGWRSIGIDNTSSSQPLSQVELPAKTVYVFGQEGPGLSAEMRAMCEYEVAIEQFGSTRSVNVGVASGIIIYEWVRRFALHREGSGA